MRYFEDGVEGDLLNNYNHDFISEFIRLGMKALFHCYTLHNKNRENNSNNKTATVNNNNNNNNSNRQQQQQQQQQNSDRQQQQQQQQQTRKTGLYNKKIHSDTFRILYFYDIELPLIGVSMSIQH